MSKSDIDIKLDTSSVSRRDAHEKVKNWIDEQDLEDIESIAESSVVDSSDNETDCLSNDDFGNVVSTTDLGTTTEIATITESLKEMLNTINSVQTVGNIKIENSTGVHIGNITNINGNIQIIQTGNGHQYSGYRRSKPKPRLARQTQPSEDLQTEHESKTRSSTKQSPPSQTAYEERVNKDAFIEKIDVKLPRKAFAILPRSTWLAQRPMEKYDYIKEPVEYVIISHTATESSEKQAINIRTTRDIQCFHIESREWNDIAYNFLVGCDANVYEGRGWAAIGAHTRGYNACGMGISFIGCFMRELPPQAALDACKFLLKKGVEDGHLAADYKLLCHCQCSPTESPGRRLYEEIQTWDHFYMPEQ